MRSLSDQISREYKEKIWDAIDAYFYYGEYTNLTETDLKRVIDRNRELTIRLTIPLGGKTRNIRESIRICMDEKIKQEIR